MIRKSYLDITLSDAEETNNSKSNSVSFLDISISSLDDSNNDLFKYEPIPSEVVFESKVQGGIIQSISKV